MPRSLEIREFNAGDLVATGCAERTGLIYARVLNLVSGLLAERGLDLMTCTGRDVAELADRFPPSHGARSQLRSALVRGWEIIGRDDPPSVRGIKVPPRPRGEVTLKMSPDAWRRLRSTLSAAQLLVRRFGSEAELPPIDISAAATVGEALQRWERRIGRLVEPPGGARGVDGKLGSLISPPSLRAAISATSGSEGPGWPIPRRGGSVGSQGR